MITPTPPQSEIRDAQELDVLVIAPAGCGKTEAMALRVAGLLQRGQIPRPRKILVTTFSNRARDNIKERLLCHLAGTVIRDRIVVANFHGLAARIFRAHANVVGLDPQMTIPDSDWVGDQCRGRGLSFRRANAVQDILRVVKQQPLDDAGVWAQLAEIGDEAALDIERQRIAEQRLTYDDLPRLAELILQNKAVADLYRCLFGSVIVDEFQDLTPQLLRMIRQIGRGRSTYAGDIAQGIYGFAGAAPAEVLREIEQETSRKIVFADSHRSSPAVLELVNALAPFTGGRRLQSADPARWPGGGMAAVVAFPSTVAEAQWARDFAALVLKCAPGHRIGVIARTAARRRFADAAFGQSALPWHRWDDPLLDTDTAKIMKAMLAALDQGEVNAEPDTLALLHRACPLESVQDPDTRRALCEALGWACDLLGEGLSPNQIRARIKMGDDSTLLTVPGVHLLTGHAGKGQQFDWVVILGTEEGCIPDFRATSPKDVAEEARVLSVMISRARHGVLLLRAAAVEARDGTPWQKQPSSFLAAFDGIARCCDRQGAVQWLSNVDWNQLRAANSESTA
jgi:DNA helicase II / ATP-dependent DNA helicase PcrA